MSERAPITIYTKLNGLTVQYRCQKSSASGPTPSDSGLKTQRRMVQFQVQLAKPDASGELLRPRLAYALVDFFRAATSAGVGRAAFLQNAAKRESSL